MRNKMSRQDRAKQFMPFAALKGYEEALRKKERIIVPKADLSEEKKEELDRVFACLAVRDMVEAVYYADQQYVKITGLVAKIDRDARILTIVTTKIRFDDLYSLEIMK